MEQLWQTVLTTSASFRQEYLPEKDFLGGKRRNGLKTTVRDNMWSVGLLIHYKARDLKRALSLHHQFKVGQPWQTAITTSASFRQEYLPEKDFLGGNCRNGLKTTVRDNL